MGKEGTLCFHERETLSVRRYELRLTMLIISTRILYFILISTQDSHYHGGVLKLQQMGPQPVPSYREFSMKTLFWKVPWIPVFTEVVVIHKWTGYLPCLSDCYSAWTWIFRRWCIKTFRSGSSECPDVLPCVWLTPSTLTVAKVKCIWCLSSMASQHLATVEPRHFGTSHFVLRWEVVLFSEGPLSEIPLYYKLANLRVTHCKADDYIAMNNDVTKEHSKVNWKLGSTRLNYSGCGPHPKLHDSAHSA